MKKSFLVQMLGYWGRGATIQEAALNCSKAGASGKDITVIDLFTNPTTEPEPRITSGGMMYEAAAGSDRIRIAKGIKLSVLLKLTE